MADKEEHIPLFNFADIPPVFYSDLTGEPFQNCIHCEKELIKSGEYYVIEKAFTQTLPHNTKSTIFEYAMCFDCWEKVRKSLSDKSLNNIQQFFQQRVDFKKRNEKLLGQNDDYDVNDWISKCIINGSPIDEAKEFQVACQCVGEHIMYDSLPYMIGDEAMDEIIELVSNQTLGEMDGFKDKLTRPSPDLEELFDRKKLLVV